MATIQFTVTGFSEAEIIIVHINEGHRYTYSIVDQDGKRVLSHTPVYRSNDAADHMPKYFEIKARQFAEAEARKLKLIISPRQAHARG
jgi:hypothetical protein